MRREFVLVVAAGWVAACGGSDGTVDAAPDVPDVASDIAGDEAVVEAGDTLLLDEAVADPVPESVEAVAAEDVVVEEADVDAVDWTTLYGAPCALSKRVGRFEVKENYKPIQDVKTASVEGTVEDGVNAQQVLTQVWEEDSCRLLQKKPSFCEPACDKDQQCSAAGTCEPFPLPGSVGTVTVTGLIVPVSIPDPSGHNYRFTDLPGDADNAFEPGAHVELTASGDEIPGFSLQGMGVPDLVMPDETLYLEPGKPFTVTWTAEPGPWRVRFSLNVDQHGLTPVTLYCDVDDTGSYTLSAALVDELLSFPASGFATTTFKRGTIDSVDVTGGCVQMEVLSSRAVQVCAKVPLAECPGT
jgi:hypothetical protein